MTMNRRQFIKVGLSSLSYFTLEATTPNWLIRSAQALPIDCLTNGRILVILQLGGGNDGLNTVIPKSDDLYYSLRPTIAVPKGQEIALDSLNGIHPQMTGIADWYNQGCVSVLQCVGYVNPDFSHFSSTDYWETGGVPNQPLPKNGWVARFFDNTCNGKGDADALFMASAGLSVVPEMLSGSQNYTPPAIRSASGYALTASKDKTIRLRAIHDINNLVPYSEEIDFLQRSENSVEASSADIAKADQLTSSGNYTSDTLGNGLKMASKIIRSGFDTRIFYVSQGGYDTHANQTGDQSATTGTHQGLLGHLSQNVDAFLSEMRDSGDLDRVMILTFSEFGRRIQENSSLGTDHGAASVMFAFGGGVNGGIYGGQPDLVDTIKGNVKNRLDFRSVYSRIIEGWFGAHAAPVFGQENYDTVIAPEFPKLQFIKDAARIRNWRNY